MTPLQIRRELAQKNRETYLPDVAMILNDLGLLDSDQNRLEESRKEFEEALRIRRELGQINAQMKVIPRSGHLSPLEVPDEIVAGIRNFLVSLRPKIG